MDNENNFDSIKEQAIRDGYDAFYGHERDGYEVFWNNWLMVDFPKSGNRLHLHKYIGVTMESPEWKYRDLHRLEQSL